MSGLNNARCEQCSNAIALCEDIQRVHLATMVADKTISNLSTTCKKNMNKKAIAALLLSQAMLFGCASYNYTDAPPTMGVMYSKYAYIGYAGELKPIEDVGIVTTDGLIKISMVDGQPISSYQVFKTSGMYSGGRYQLHLLPGTHVLSMGFRDDRGNGSISWSTSDLKKTISIAKGQVIHLSVAGSGRSSWTAKESDGSSVLSLIASDFKELTKSKAGQEKAP